jgi:hypothetical protein
MNPRDLFDPAQNGANVASRRSRIHYYQAQDSAAINRAELT